MLEKVNLEKKINKETYKKEITHLQEELSVLQQKLKEAGLPVIILFDGWGAAGKGSLISRLIQNFDPRGFKVYSNDTPEEFEKRRPLLWRYWKTYPSAASRKISAARRCSGASTASRSWSASSPTTDISC